MFEPPLTLAAPSAMTEHHDEDARDDAMDALRRGHPMALGRMYTEHHASVQRVVRRVMGPDSDHDDLVQEVFYHAIKGISGYRGDRWGVGPWLRQIAVMRCRKRIRYRRVRWWLSWRAPEDLPEPTAAVSADEHAMLARAWGIISSMPTEERIVFTLRFIEQLTIPEIVDATQSSRTTVKRRIDRARQVFDSAAARDVLLRTRAASKESP